MFARAQQPHCLKKIWPPLYSFEKAKEPKRLCN